MAAIPENFGRLHAEEERIRALSIAAIETDDEMRVHLAMIEASMDVLDVYRQQDEQSEEGRTIQFLAIRVFNGLACAWKLFASGYYQKAALSQRDLIETVDLVNYFHIAPEKIPEWLAADRKVLMRQFGPKAIRDALDADMGMGRSKREENYIKFSNLAAHPTRQGFDMLRPQGKLGQMGPFFDRAGLLALLQEQGPLAVQAGFAFGVYADTDRPVTNTAVHHFLVSSMDYSGRFYGKHYSAEERAEVDDLHGFGPPKGATDGAV